MSEIKKNVLKCQNINKSINGKEILKNISLDIQEGDILGFIGPNGAGKTTTLKTIVGLQEIDSGKIEINGFDIRKKYRKAIEHIGVIIEEPDMYMYLSGMKNLKLWANLYKNIGRQQINEAVNLVGLENRINDKISTYSLGMRQRLGLAQAILHKPNLLILDEPTNGLDPEGIIELRNILKKLAKEENIGILISSHNLAEMETFCNKICIIQNGKVIENRNIDELKNNLINNRIIFKVSSSNKAKKILKGIKIVDENHFEICIEDNKIKSIIKQLLDNDIDIYRIKNVDITLEDIFIEKTRGNKID